MGLDVSHDCWHGGYGSFHIFRQALAKAAGIPLTLMEGYYRTESYGGTPYPPYQPVHNMRVEELKQRPDLSVKVTDWDALRYYQSKHTQRDGSVEVYEYVEYPDPFSDPLYGVDSQVLEWLRARGPDGPLCGSHLGPRAYDWIVDAAQWLPLKWDYYNSDPIVTLLNHSDCDGDIRGVRVQKALADRLDELADLMPEDVGGGHLHRNGGPGAAARQFAKGLREAASKRQVVTFG